MTGTDTMPPIEGATNQASDLDDPEDDEGGFRAPAGQDTATAEARRRQVAANASAESQEARNAVAALGNDVADGGPRRPQNRNSGHEEEERESYHSISLMFLIDSMI